MIKNSGFARAFTMIEMVVVLGIIAIMMAFVYPAYLGMSQRAKATKDMSNLRQIGIAMQTLLNDNDQLLPVTTTWPGISTSTTPVLYPKYLSGRRVLESPFDKRASDETDSAPVSYSINANIYFKLGTNPNMLKVVSPSSTFLMAPKYTGDPANASSWTGMGTATSAPDLPVGAPAETKGTHSNGRQINVLFCDWHTEILTFGPGTTPGTFQDWQSVPLGVKHWDPTQ